MKAITMRSHAVLALLVSVSLGSGGCRPTPRELGCVTRVNLARITPLDAMDCGDFMIFVRDELPVIDATSGLAIQCANTAIAAQTSFVLRERGVVPPAEECPPNSQCAGAVGVTRVFAGARVNGVYTVASYYDGIDPVAILTDGGIVPNLPDGGYQAQRPQMRKRICQPTVGAILAPLPAVPNLSIECVVAEGMPTQLELRDSQNACIAQ